MRFITIRDLRSKSAQIQRQLPKEKEMVLTSNGKPIAILSATSGDALEKSLAMARRIRAESAVTSLQKRSLETGSNLFSLSEINAEITAVRKRRK